MADNIKVAVRIRPLIQRELTQELEPLWGVDGGHRIVKLSETSPSPESYTFDYVFDNECETSKVYDSCVLDIVDSAMLGFNGTIFAYGQTSSGKTHTIMGTDTENGVLSLVVDRIFEIISTTPGRQYILVVSFMEIYMEEIQDLMRTGPKVTLPIREKKGGEVFVDNLVTHRIEFHDDVIEIVKNGQARRHTSATSMNDRSSRSHTIFRIGIESCERGAEGVDDSVTVSHLNIVDLAGSEKSSQAGTQGDRLKEGSAINKSLTNLTRVINQLVDNEPHVSFRDSKLTRILQNALGGNSKTVVICNVTPVSNSETSSTLKFASNAKRIKNHPQKNEIISEETQMKRYQKEMLDMQKQMEMMKENRDIEENEKDALRAMIDNLKKCLLNATTTTPSLPPEKKSARRRTWCPGGRISAMPLTPTSPIHRLPRRVSANVEGSFQAFNTSDVLEELSEIEKLKKEEFNNDTMSPGSIDAPKKRARVGGFEPRLISVKESPPTVPSTREVQIQTDLEETPVADKVDVLSNLQTDFRVFELQDELQSQMDHLEKVENEKEVLEKRVQELELHLHQSKSMCTSDTNTTLPPTPVSPSPAVEQKMKDLRAEIDTLKGEKSEMSLLLQSGVDKEIQEEMTSLIARVQQLETENESLKISQDIEIQFEDSSAPKAPSNKGRKSVHLISFDDDVKPTDFGLNESLDRKQNQILTPIPENCGESFNILNLSEQKTNLLDDSNELSGRESAELPEATKEDLQRMVEEALRMVEAKQDKVEELESSLYTSQANVKSMKLELIEKEDQICTLKTTLDNLDGEYMDLRSFQIHEMSSMSPATPKRASNLTALRTELTESQGEVLRLKEEVCRVKVVADLAQDELAKIKDTDVSDIKDQLDWKSTADEYSGALLEIKEKLTVCQTKLESEQTKYMELKAECEKLGKQNEVQSMTIADYEWFLEEEKKKNKKKIGELTNMLDEARQEQATNLNSSLSEVNPCNSEEMVKLKEELARLQDVSVDIKPSKDLLLQVSYALTTLMDGHRSALFEWMSTYESVVSKCQSKVSQLTAALSIVMAKKLEIESDLVAATDKIVSLEKDNDTLVEENAGLHQQLLVQSCVAADNTNEQRLQANIDKLKQDLEKVKLELVNAQKTGLEFESVRSDFEKKLRELEEQNNALRDLEAQNNALRNLEEENNALRDLEAQNNALRERDLEVQNNALRDLEAKNNALRDLETKTSALRDLEAKNNALRDLEEQNKASKMSLQAELEKVQEDVKVAKQDLLVEETLKIKLEQRLVKVEEEKDESYQTFIAQLAELEKSISSKDTLIVALENELQTLQVGAGELKGEIGRGDEMHDISVQCTPTHDTADVSMQATPLFECSDESYSANYKFPEPNFTFSDAVNQADHPEVETPVLLDASVQVNDAPMETSDASVQVNDVVDELNDALAMVEQLKEQYDEMDAATREQVAHTEELMGERHDIIEGLKGDKQSLLERVNALVASLQEIESHRISALKSKQEEIDTLKLSLSQAQQSIQANEDKLKLVSQLELELTEKCAELKRISLVEDQLRSSKRRLEEACDEADQQEEELRQELEQCRVSIESLEGTIAHKDRELAGMKDLQENCARLSLKIAEQEQEIADWKLELQKEGLVVANLEADLKNVQREKKTEAHRNKEEVRLRDNQIRNLKDDLRARTIEMGDDVTDVVRKPKRTAPEEKVPLVYEPPASATGSGIIDALVYHAERRKNYELEKSVKTLNNEVQALKKKLGEIQVPLWEENEPEVENKGRPSHASSGFGASNCMSTVSESDIIHLSSVSTSMPPPAVRPPSASTSMLPPAVRPPSSTVHPRSQKVPLLDSRVHTTLPPLGHTSSYSKLDQENAPPHTPKTKKRPFFASPRSKADEKKSVDSPSQQCKTQ